MPVIDHDVPPGNLERCQITGSTNLFEAIDLGHQPPCDAMLTGAELLEPEVSYPLRLNICPESGLGQLGYVLDTKAMFRPEYPYRSGISPPLVAYQHALAGEIVERLHLPPESLCVDIGSNDGTLLHGFIRAGMRVLGVEPTNVAKIAEASGVPTAQAFFTERLARTIAGQLGKAKVITATNSFAHMAELGEVCRGIRELLDDDGVFVSESHYLLDVLRKNQFDTILHEHIRTYSLKSLVMLFPSYGMEVFDVQRGDRYGGNIRVYAGLAGRRRVSDAVLDLLWWEEESGLFCPETWQAFRDRVNANRDTFMAMLWRAKSEGKLVAAQSCPGRCVPLLNYYGITPGLLSCIGELPGSLKIGLYTPGGHIPVVDGSEMIEMRPDCVMINAWHYGDIIARRLRDEGLSATLVAALPSVTVYDAV